MDENHVAATDLECKLTHGFKKRQTLDVARSAADLSDKDISAFAPGINAILDFVGYVGNHLHRLAEIVTAPLFLNYGFVNLSGGQTVEPREFATGESFVMT